MYYRFVVQHVVQQIHSISMHANGVLALFAAKQTLSTDVDSVRSYPSSILMLISFLIGFNCVSACPTDQPVRRQCSSLISCAQRVGVEL